MCISSWVQSICRCSIFKLTFAPNVLRNGPSWNIRSRDNTDQCRVRPCEVTLNKKVILHKRKRYNARICKNSLCCSVSRGIPHPAWGGNPDPSWQVGVPPSILTGRGNPYSLTYGGKVPYLTWSRGGGILIQSDREVPPNRTLGQGYPKTG